MTSIIFLSSLLLFAMMCNMMDLTTGIMSSQNPQSARCMVRSTSKKTSMPHRPLNFWTSLSMISWAVSLLDHRSSLSKRDSYSQSCLLTWLPWSNWEMSSRNTWTSLASRTRRTGSFWSTTHPLKLSRQPSSWYLASPSMLVTSVPLWDHMRSVPNGLTCCSMSSSTKEIWKRLNNSTSLWCATVLPPTLLEVKLDSSSSSLCQSSSNLLTFAQKSITCNSRVEDRTSKSGKLEPNLKRNKRKRKIRWRRSLPKLFPKETSLTP